MSNELNDNLVEDLRTATKLGDELAVAAARVCAEYDGIHRLRAALATWYNYRAGIHGADTQGSNAVKPQTDSEQ